MRDFKTSISRFFFLFFFIFFVSIVFVNTIGLLPIVIDFFHWLVPAFSKTFGVVNYPITIFNNGSGDTTYNWVVHLMIFIFSIIGAFIWFLLKQNDVNYIRLQYWLLVILRFFVALMLIDYGLIKVWKLQFPFPSAYRLNQNYGDSSPMGLAWTFLGFSYGYNVFMGIAELLAGLMFWRRTVVLGAVVSLFTTLNVVAINFFYDVPVKIFSTTLLLMTLYILSYNFSDLFDFYLGQKTSLLKPHRVFRFKKSTLNKTLFWVKHAVIFLLVGSSALSAYQSYQGLEVAKHEVFGYYELAGGNGPADFKWQKINFSFNDLARLYDDKGSTMNIEVKLDSTKKRITFNDNVKLKKSWNFEYSVKNDTLSLSSKPAVSELIFIQKNASNTRLMSRGFHWINETPYNY